MWLGLKSAFLSSAVLLLLAALLTVHPLLMHGNSCGHDMGFHMLSWVDAAHQIHNGTLYPHWTTPAAWNAGEPRFVFYPPLSWMLGASLVGAAHILHLPTSVAPMLYIWIALAAAGLTMHHLARHFVSPRVALIAAALYLANPYMLFNAFERSAFAELLAAAWIPLLLLAVLRERPSARGIAIPIALLWLTNAPAAVMGCYMFALLAALRFVVSFVRSHSRERTISGRRLATTYLSGAAIGLALPAFYLVPAAYERRFVQVAMAIIANMRFQDNFLFDDTADAAHNIVNHTVSVLAIVLVALAVAVLSAIFLHSQSRTQTPDRLLQRSDSPPLFVSFSLAILTLLITFLLVPLSTPLWNHVPELAFLQFPWRLLTILSAVLYLAVALLLGRLPQSRSTSWNVAAIALLAPLLLSALGYHLYAQGCDPTDMPVFIDAIVADHHGVMPTDEYTPLNADNDVLRTDNPGYWLAATPGAPAPNTHPTAAEFNPTLPNDDVEPPLSQTVSTPAPRHLELNLTQPEDLVLNLRDYPDWQVKRNGASITKHLQRDDGLLAIALPAGISVIDIQWRETRDQQFGLGLSGCGLLAFGLTFRSRRIKLNP
jgi:hypothetical protein